MLQRFNILLDVEEAFIYLQVNDQVESGYSWFQFYPEWWIVSEVLVVTSAHPGEIEMYLSRVKAVRRNLGFRQGLVTLRRNG